MFEIQCHNPFGSNTCSYDFFIKIVHVEASPRSQVAGAWDIPISAFLKLTIPSTSPSEWSRFYSSANVAFCPAAILFLGFRSIIPPNHGITIFLLALAISLPFSVALYLRQTEPPSEEQLMPTLLAFCMSVLWISTTAGELMSCLGALGAALGLSQAVLGLTVLAWGNSAGDLVADIAVARAGRPAMAMAGCFAGPMFNMLVGLGTGLTFSAAEAHPRPYKLRFHASIVVAFIFLLLSLMGSLLVITWCRFRVPRFWGFFLVSLYALFTLVSIAVSTLSA